MRTDRSLFALESNQLCHNIVVHLRHLERMYLDSTLGTPQIYLRPVFRHYSQECSPTQKYNILSQTFIVVIISYIHCVNYRTLVKDLIHSLIFVAANLQSAARLQTATRKYHWES